MVLFLKVMNEEKTYSFNIQSQLSDQRSINIQTSTLDLGVFSHYNSGVTYPEPWHAHRYKLCYHQTSNSTLINES